MTDHNKTRALYLLRLEKDRLMSLRKTQAARDKRATMRKDAYSYAALGIIAGVAGIIAGPPEVHLFTLVAFACAFFCGRSLPQYKNYGGLIEGYKEHQDSLTRQIEVQRGVTDLTRVHQDITTPLGYIRACTEAVCMDLRGKG